MAGYWLKLLTAAITDYCNGYRVLQYVRISTSTSNLSSIVLNVNIVIVLNVNIVILVMLYSNLNAMPNVINRYQY